MTHKQAKLQKNKIIHENTRVVFVICHLITCIHKYSIQDDIILLALFCCILIIIMFHNVYQEIIYIVHWKVDGHGLKWAF